MQDLHRKTLCDKVFESLCYDLKQLQNWNWPSGRQFLSASCSTAGKHFAAVAGGHSFSEAVLFCSMTLLRLISSLHDAASSTVNLYKLDFVGRYYILIISTVSILEEKILNATWRCLAIYCPFLLWMALDMR